MALFSVMGFSFSGAASNQGLMFVRLKPFDDRIGDEHSVQSVLGRISGPLFGIPGAIVVGFTPPAIQGLSRFGGFEFQVLDQSGGDINRLAQATQAIVGAGNQFAEAATGPVQHVHRERPPAAGHDRSGARACARTAAQRDHERAADLPGVAVRERLRVQQPRVPGVRAGRPEVQIQPAGASAALCADTHRRHGGARAGRADGGNDRAAGDQPFQPVPIGVDQRIGGARA